MSVKFNIQAFSGYINETSNKYYTPARLDAALATCERFFLQLRLTEIGGAPKITVISELSNDGINWGVRSTLLSAVTIPGSGLLFATETGASTVGGRFARLSAQISGTFTPKGYLEMWICGRSAA